MPLVIAIGGLVLCFAIIIFFVWWGNRTSPKGPTRPAARKKRAEVSEPDEEAALDEDKNESDEEAE